MRNVFVVDTNKQPLNTIHPGEARLLLSRGKAAVLKRYPFTIILKVAILKKGTEIANNTKASSAPGFVCLY